MTTKRSTRTTARVARPASQQASASRVGLDLPAFVLNQLFATQVPTKRRAAKTPGAKTRRDSGPAVPIPGEVVASSRALAPEAKRFHGARVSLGWFPWPWLRSQCADRFGYLTPGPVRAATRLPFNATTIGLLDQLGQLMADSGPETSPDGPIPAGFTYIGQFVDHDITLDVASVLDAPTDANTIRNMRSPALDLDAVYGRGPALDPFLYVFPTAGPPTAIKFAVGSNSAFGPGGPSGPSGNPGSMVTKTDFDVPRASTQTAIIGDPRNDENLIVSQFHHAMLRLHNSVVDLLVSRSFSGDVFLETRLRVTRHYQWAVVNDFLRRVCGAAAMSTALTSVSALVGSPFRMPVEFSVAAYRFGHSMIRDRYWVNHNFPAATLGQVFEFARVPRLPVFSNWVVDFNALLETGFPVPVFNRARKIDSVLATGLESLPGLSGMMAVLAQRNLRRGLALGLPSGQGVATFFGVPTLTAAELQQNLPASETAVLQANGGLLLKKTPLWYYILREAMVRHAGDQLGPVGARIVAETFVSMLKRDDTSFLNVPGFLPTLPSAVPGTFTFADLAHLAGVTKP